MDSEPVDSEPIELGRERRAFERFPTAISVDYRSDDNFLFSYITNISEMGIFIRTDDPLPVGTELTLRFGVEESVPLELEGVVTWINPLRTDAPNLNPGMGIQFQALAPPDREKLVQLVRTIAYLRDFSN